MIRRGPVLGESYPITLDPPHVVIMTSATGGGHTACAKALEVGLNQASQGTIKISIVDLWTDYAPRPLNWLPASYYFIAHKAPYLWQLLWLCTQSTRFSGLLFSLVGYWIRPRVVAAYQELKPDLVVAVHPIVQQGVYYAWRSDCQNQHWQAVPWITVVTDLTTVHPYWYHPQAKLCVVPTSEAYESALAVGMPHTIVRQIGLPARTFNPPSAQMDPTALQCLRLSLGIASTCPIVLIIGGGEGMGPLREITAAISQSLIDHERVVGQIIVICGRNHQLMRELSQIEWPVPVSIKGHVDNIHEWMAVCDCVVTKAGPGTISDALNAGRPLLLTGYIPGQEKANVTYVLDKQVGLYCDSLEGIAAIVRRWLLHSPAERQMFAAKAAEIAQPNADTDVATAVLEILHSHYDYQNNN